MSWQALLLEAQRHEDMPQAIERNRIEIVFAEIDRKAGAKSMELGNEGGAIERRDVADQFFNLGRGKHVGLLYRRVAGYGRRRQPSSA